MKLRRRVRVSALFDIAADPSDPMGELQTCRTCGAVERYRHETTPGMAKRMIAYRSKGAILGVCPSCSRAEAVKRYPLSEKPA